MILTVTLNAALDVTYEVERLVPQSSHRVRHVRTRAGGKGVNVSRVLTALGHETVVTGLVGGPTGDLLGADLHAAGLPHALVPIAGDTRRTVTVAADGDATVFNEPGPRVRPEEWETFIDHFTRLSRTAEVVVLSGSLPPGLFSGAYAQLIRLARAAGAATVLDTSGPALPHALSAGPDVVKPNAAELADVTGRSDLPAAAARLRALGARTVVASAGPEGLYARTADTAWRAIPPQHVHGNPTGAGDACVAALAAGLAGGSTWPDLLREAVALSAAAVAAPAGGEFVPDAYQRFRTTATVEELCTPLASVDES